MARVNYPSALERLLYALITLVFAACACCGLGGCEKKDKPNITDWAEICVYAPNPNAPKVLVRSDDRSCEATPTPDTKYHWLYVNQRESGFIKLPGAGQNVPDGDDNPADTLVTSTMRPAGVTIGRVPNRGGLGVATP